MKRVLLLAVLCMSVLLVGCGGGEEGVTDVVSKNIKVAKEMQIAKVTATIQSVTVKEGTIEIPIRWQHWASNDKVHFSVLAFPEVYQGDNHLVLISGEDSMHKQIPKGVDGMVDLKYELLDEETPVTIKIIATTDDMEEGAVTVDISNS